VNLPWIDKGGVLDTVSFCSSGRDRTSRVNCGDTLPPEPGSDCDVSETWPVARVSGVVGSKWRLAVLRCPHLRGHRRFDGVG
jgi:hypothetical protein